MRTLVDLPEAQIAALSGLGKRVNQSRAALIREAVAEYLDRHAPRRLDAAFGLWGAEAPDGVDYQRTMRAEW